MTITVRYAAVDGYRTARKFKTIEAARAFAVEMVGKNPETYGNSYAVADDGVGTVRVEGCTLAALFGHKAQHGVKAEEGRFSLLHGDKTSVFAGPAFEMNTEDGPVAACNFFCGLTIAGIDFAHPHPFASRYAAEAFAAKVTARGTIAHDLWVKVEPYDRERELELAWMDEQEDRRAWGAC